MRFREFKIINEAPDSNVVVIGDSIAVGIGGESAYAKGGISTAEVLNRVNTFIKTGKAKGATVILSSGASNSAPVQIEGGEKRPGNLAPIAQQLKALKDAGASVALVGVGSEKSTWFPPTKFTNGKRYQVDLTGVNQQLESMAAANGAKFLGPLEDYDTGMHTGKGDGIHPYAGYKKLLAAGSKGAGVTLGPKDQAPGAPASKNKTDAGAGTKPATTPSATLTIGPPFETADDAAVKAIQQSLEDLGYSVGSTGVDGKYGPRTAAAIAAFKKDYKLTGDGNNVDADVNKMLDDVKTGKVPKVAAPTQVAKVTGALPPLSTDAVTQGKVGEVLNFIARFESRGDYNIILGGDRPKLTTMTIAQVYDLQSQMLRQGKESSAVGRYQYIGTTLKEMVKLLGLDIETTKFNEKTQDAIAIADLRRRAGLDNWLSGSLSNDRFLENLSRIWAGLPSPSKGGASFYSGVGSNAAGTGLQAALGTLQSINAGTAVA